MEEVYKETACFTIDKYQLSKLKDDEAFKEFIINDLSDRLADHLVDILSSEGEILVSMSDVCCHDNNDFLTVDYRQYIKWRHLVRCKDCKHYWKNSNDFNDSTVCLASPKDEAFCSEGERKETEDEIQRR